MRVLCVFGQYNYGDPKRGQGYEYTNFIPALQRLGHEVLFFESRNRDHYQDFRDMNHSLLKTVEEEEPDVVFAAISNFEIWLETWGIIRESGIAATVNWATDDTYKYAQSSRFIAPFLHAYTTTYPHIIERYKSDGIEHVLLTQWAANARTLLTPLPAVECKYPVSFVGMAHGTRKKWIEKLRLKGVHVDCFGYGWPNGPVPAEEIPRIMRQSIISLNFSNAGLVWEGIRPRRVNQIKARTFEVPGAGGFLLTQWAEGIDRYYAPGEEIVVYQEFDDLASQIKYYLSHPSERDQIAEAGFVRTKSEHLYDQRIAKVLEFALKEKQVYESRHSIVNPQILSWEKFNDAEEKYQMNRFQVGLKRFLENIASIIWGTKRGPRAARVLIYQLSFRLVGAHTYSSAGWPGRMFYKET